ncbi:MAG: hypothetical protein M3537_05600 [Chloroflexota bacterium]|nr:hypothetical protein [Chloroflexota bacterium]
MPEESQEYSLLCSACYTPCTGALAHVVPTWNTTMRIVVTTYRCERCWVDSLAEMREAVRADAEVRLSLCDFLSRRGYEKDAETIRAAEAELQQTYLIRVIDAIETGELVFEP